QNLIMSFFDLGKMFKKYSKNGEETSVLPTLRASWRDRSLSAATAAVSVGINLTNRVKGISPYNHPWYQLVSVGESSRSLRIRPSRGTYGRTTSSSILGSAISVGTKTLTARACANASHSGP